MYSEHSPTSKMDFFTIAINGFQLKDNLLIHYTVWANKE